MTTRVVLLLFYDVLCAYGMVQHTVLCSGLYSSSEPSLCMVPSEVRAPTTVVE